MSAIEEFNAAYAKVQKEFLMQRAETGLWRAGLEAERANQKEALHAERALAESVRRDLQAQLAAAQRAKKRADKQHAKELAVVRARAAEYRTKLAEYRRELVSVKSALRKQSHE